MALRMLRRNPTATALFELTCGAVGVRKGFQDACEHAGQTVDKGRADLSGLTKLIQGTWGKSRGWPLNWAQEGTRIVYYASQALADAWKATW